MSRGGQPFRSYGDTVSVAAGPGLGAVLGELVELRKEGDDRAFVGFFYGIFTSAGTRAAYDLGLESCGAALLNMRRCGGLPASTEFFEGGSVDGVLAVVPRGSIEALDDVEGAPEWYRRELVPIEGAPEGAAAARRRAQAQFYQMNCRDGFRLGGPAGA